jgi:UDP-N-acetylmuramoyl-tripeptide--D-alanyl-D-alanine ligase
MLNEIAVNKRKFLILGEMGELGKHSLLLHKKLYDYLINLNINLVIFVGKNTKNLYNISKNNIECSWSESAEQVIKSDIDKFIKPMDTILVKGSRYMKMEVVVNYLRDKYKIKVNN